MIKSRPVDISRLRHLYPFQSNYLNVNGFQYHYVDEGEGKPVLMIHGNPTWSFYYRRLIRELSPQFRAIAVDHIGCGLSEKPDIKDYDYRLESRINDMDLFIEQMGLKQKQTLILHDWGGIIGVAYALRHMDRIDGIVLFNTAAFFPPTGKNIPLRLEFIRNFRCIAQPAVLGLNLFARGASFMASAKGLSKDVRAGLVAPYNCWRHRIATLKFVEDIPLKKTDASYSIVAEVERNLHKLKHLPMLICWGMKDFVFDPDYLAEWKRRFPDAIVQIFEDSGHYVMEDSPDQIIREVKNFLSII